MDITLEEITNIDLDYKLVRNSKIKVKAMICPDRNAILYNPFIIDNEEDWHITLLHEWLHDLYPRRPESNWFDDTAEKLYQKKDIKEFLTIFYPWENYKPNKKLLKKIT